MRDPAASRPHRVSRRHLMGLVKFTGSDISTQRVMSMPYGVAPELGSAPPPPQPTSLGKSVEPPIATYPSVQLEQDYPQHYNAPSTADAPPIDANLLPPMTTSSTQSGATSTSSTSGTGTMQKQSLQPLQHQFIRSRRPSEIVDASTQRRAPMYSTFPDTRTVYGAYGGLVAYGPLPDATPPNNFTLHDVSTVT